MPKLSIITINYNNKTGLEKTIRSVLEQVYANFEYIVIDGGSTDGSAELLKQNNLKITRWISEKDAGIYAAMNKGIALASGEYCLFLNSGDFLYAKTTLSEIFNSSIHADIAYGNMMIDWGNNKITLGRMPNKISFYQLYTDTLWHPVSFIKRKLFTDFGNYDETFKMVGDYDFFFRVLVKYRATTQYLDLTVSHYSTNGFSSQPEHKKMEQQERKKVHEKYLSPLLLELAESYHQQVQQKKTNWFKRLLTRKN